MMAAKHLTTEHGIICHLPEERFGYFAWPTVARLCDGTLVVTSSGLRSRHLCPWGKTVLNSSTDDGQTWSAPRVINSSPLDDRDAGIVALGGDRLLVTWFTGDTRLFFKEQWVLNSLDDAERECWRKTLDSWTDDLVQAYLGSWAMVSNDRGATWSAPIRIPVSSPHGPIKLHDNSLLHLGKRYVNGWDEMVNGQIIAVHSADGGRTWTDRGVVPLSPHTEWANYHEPHVVELPSGRLLGMIRIENHGDASLDRAGLTTFSMMQTESDDGGVTWSMPMPLSFHGSPPHLLRHSSGALLLTYSFRQTPFGQRVAISHDDGASWEHDWIIRDDGPDADLGYPSTVELADGSLFTVYYQQVAKGEKCSLLWSHWQLP